MQKMAIAMLAVACVLGGASVYFVRGMIEQNREIVVQEVAPSMELTTIVVANKKLGFGDQLTADLVRVIDWPVKSLPPGAFQSVEDLLTGGDRRVVLKDIEANEPVYASRVSGFGGRASLSALIGEQMRAATIRVNDVSGIAGFVLPGDRVDVHLTHDITKDELVTDLLIENVRVLAVDQLANDDANTPTVAKAVTLEVSGEQSQKLSLAANVGSLGLSLRNHTDAVSGVGRTVRLLDLRTRPPGVYGPQIQVFRGTESTSIDVVRERKSNGTISSSPKRKTPVFKHAPLSAPKAGEKSASNGSQTMASAEPMSVIPQPVQ